MKKHILRKKLLTEKNIVKTILSIYNTVQTLFKDGYSEFIIENRKTFFSISPVEKTTRLEPDLNNRTFHTLPKMTRKNLYLSLRPKENNKLKLLRFPLPQDNIKFFARTNNITALLICAYIMTQETNCVIGIYRTKEIIISSYNLSKLQIKVNLSKISYLLRKTKSVATV